MIFIIFILFSYLISSLLLQDGITGLIWASGNGHLDIVRTLQEGGVDVDVKDKVRNQLMMMMMIIILLTILIMMMMMMMMIVVINDEDGDDCI